MIFSHFSRPKVQIARPKHTFPLKSRPFQCIKTAKIKFHNYSKLSDLEFLLGYNTENMWNLVIQVVGSNTIMKTIHVGLLNYF